MLSTVSKALKRFTYRVEIRHTILTLIWVLTYHVFLFSLSISNSMESAEQDWPVRCEETALVSAACHNLLSPTRRKTFNPWSRCFHWVETGDSLLRGKQACRPQSTDLIQTSHVCLLLTAQPAFYSSFQFWVSNIQSGQACTNCRFLSLLHHVDKHIYFNREKYTKSIESIELFCAGCCSNRTEHRVSGHISITFVLWPNRKAKKMCLH